MCVPEGERLYLFWHYPSTAQSFLLCPKDQAIQSGPLPLDDLAQESSLGFALDGQDIIEGYPLAPCPPPGECRSAWFHEYIREHVYLGVKALLENEPSRKHL